MRRGKWDGVSHDNASIIIKAHDADKDSREEFFAPMFVAFFTLFGVKLCRRREGELTATECGSEKVISEVDELKVIFN